MSPVIFTVAAGTEGHVFWVIRCLLGSCHESSRVQCRKSGSVQCAHVSAIQLGQETIYAVKSMHRSATSKRMVDPQWSRLVMVFSKRKNEHKWVKMKNHEKTWKHLEHKGCMNRWQHHMHIESWVWPQDMDHWGSFANTIRVYWIYFVKRTGFQTYFGESCLVVSLADWLPSLR